MKPLVNDRLLREELARLEREGTPEPVPEIIEDGIYPPASGKRLEPKPVIGQKEVARMRAIVQRNGIELINDGASYRAKRGRDFMIWTLETSPLEPEERGGGEAHALWEIVCRFCPED